MAQNIYMDEVLANITDQIKLLIEAEMKDDGILTVGCGLRNEIQYYSSSMYRRNKEVYPVILTILSPTQNVTSTSYCQEEHQIEVGFYVYVKNALPDVGVAEASKIASRIRRIFRRKENLRLGLTDGSIVMITSNTFMRDSTSERLAQNNIYSAYASINIKFKTIEL